jgi:hypothetical protein
VLTAIPVMTGVPVRLFTLDRNLPKGSRLSRAIENITREAEAWMARVAENIATATRASSVFPSQVESWLSMIHAMPPVDRSSPRLGADIRAARIIRPPPTNDTSRALTMALGAVRRESLVSSERSAALSNPYMT